jgi:integrase
MRSYEVRIWEIRPKKNATGTTYQVRWRVGDAQKTKNFAGKALADSFRSDLVRAVRAGEPFDTLSGLPEAAIRRAQSTTWLEHAMGYAAMKWPRASAKHRSGIAEALTTVTPALITTQRGAPTGKEIRDALYGWAFNLTSRKAPPDRSTETVIRWLGKNTRRMADLDDAKVIRSALDAVALRLDGKVAAAVTIRRKRAIFYNCLRYAVEQRLIPANPIDTVHWSAPEQDDTIDPSVVINPKQATNLLNAVRQDPQDGPRFVAFFGCLYYAALRPGEATALRIDNCDLPESGWGKLKLSRSEPRAGSRWTDTGEVRDDRGLKHRSSKASREVPIPPPLVTLLRTHLAEYPASADGRVFRTTRGRPLQESSYGRLWARSRVRALTAVQADSALARRPYDLRHAAVSTWLNAGVPPTEVAARAGHSVAVLHRVYAKCLDGSDHLTNRLIEAALASDQ